MHLGLRRERSDRSKYSVFFIIFRGERAQALRKNSGGERKRSEVATDGPFFVRAAPADLAH